MNKKWAAICGLVLIAGLMIGWFVHFKISEAELSSYQSELTNLKKHGTLKLDYDPNSLPGFYNVGDIFNITLSVSYDWFSIQGNITNLTGNTMNKIALLLIPRYPDNSLDIGVFTEHTEVEVLWSGQTKEFSLHPMGLEENQPFDLLFLY
jgi:hypothetical protein